MECPNCGAAVTPQTKFCGSCGQAIPAGLKDKLAGAAKAGIGKVQEVRANIEAARAADWAARGVVFECVSHEEGRNATVTLFTDRVERARERSRVSLSRAKQEAEVIPLRAISSVQTKKDGLRYTKVIVHATGNPIEFRVTHADAQPLKDAITRLVLARDSQGSTPAPAAPVAADPIEQVKKLAELRDAGILSNEEFETKKRQLLGLD